MKKQLLTLLLMLSIQIVCAQTKTQRTNLPSVYIETFNNAAIVSKTTYIYAKLTYIDGDSTAVYDSLSIRGRGNSTWGLPKKPYRIKFLQKEKFLGKGYAKAKSWTLLANAADKPMLRNAITSEMGEWMGLKFNPAARFVDLTLNGTYLGTYQISDQVEVRAHRVDIVEQDEPATGTSNITGGYLLEVDGFQDGNCFVSSQAVPIRIHYPDEDVIVAAQNNYIKNYVNNFEGVLMGGTYKDADAGYRPFIDSLSLARWYIATEISANIDGFYSTYFYKDQDNPKLFWGPLWDYDIAYNNCSRKGDVSQSLMCDVGYGATKTWVNRMWTDPWFGALVCREYDKMVADGMETHLLAKVDSLAELLDASQKLNYKKWAIGSKMYSDELVLFSTYAEYVTYLKDFISRHMAYLSTAFAQKKTEPDPMPTPPFSLTEGYYYRIVNAGSTNAINIVDQSTDDGANTCAWANEADCESEDWEIRQVGEYYQLINRNSGLALNDPADEAVYSTRLNQTAADSTNTRQLWTFQPQGTAGYYNLVNAHTGHVANNASGSTANGNPILSYMNEASKNATSTNRLWYIVPTDDAVPNGIADVEQTNYALLFSTEGQRLRFVADNPQELSFTATVYTLNGQQIGRFRASEAFSLSHLPHGTYIVSWTFAGKRQSRKFVY